MIRQSGPENIARAYANADVAVHADKDGKVRAEVLDDLQSGRAVVRDGHIVAAFPKRPTRCPPRRVQSTSIDGREA